MKQHKIVTTVVSYIFCILYLTSCFEVPDRDIKPFYVYSYNDENSNIVAEIYIKTKDNTSFESISASIPYLKYNKSWLMILTMDDCKQDAYCRVWAAINGKPLPVSESVYYNAANLLYGDMPLNVYYLNKTLGSTDGAGNEVRFNFTTTLSPEENFMNAYPSPTGFNMFSGLIWDNVREIVNYDNGIAFHNVKADDESDVEKIKDHFALAQEIIIKQLNGRGCKTLAEPDGNKKYIEAASNYPPIQIMTAQSQAEKLFPGKVNSSIYKNIIQRDFYRPCEWLDNINKILSKSPENREAFCVGIHGMTGRGQIDTLALLNDLFGKDGDDSMWFTSLEEYYEYSEYRLNTTIKKSYSNDTLKLTVSIPSQQYFYYPSITINLTNVSMSNVIDISSSKIVSGMSYAKFGNGIMINIDCRKHLLEHAVYFVEKYEDNPSKSNRDDALYFVNRLKTSQAKQALLQRLN